MLYLFLSPFFESWSPQTISALAHEFPSTFSSLSETPRWRQQASNSRMNKKIYLVSLSFLSQSWEQRLGSLLVGNLVGALGPTRQQGPTDPCELSSPGPWQSWASTSLAAAEQSRHAAYNSNLLYNVNYYRGPLLLVVFYFFNIFVASKIRRCLSHHIQLPTRMGFHTLDAITSSGIHGRTILISGNYLYFIETKSYIF